MEEHEKILNEIVEFIQEEVLKSLQISIIHIKSWNSEPERATYQTGEVEGAPFSDAFKAQKTEGDLDYTQHDEDRCDKFLKNLSKKNKNSLNATIWRAIDGLQEGIDEQVLGLKAPDGTVLVAVSPEKIDSDDSLVLMIVPLPENQDAPDVNPAPQPIVQFQAPI